MAAGLIHAYGLHRHSRDRNRCQDMIAVFIDDGDGVGGYIANVESPQAAVHTKGLGMQTNFES